MKKHLLLLFASAFLAAPSAYAWQPHVTTGTTKAGNTYVFGTTRNPYTGVSRNAVGVYQPGSSTPTWAAIGNSKSGGLGGQAGGKSFYFGAGGPKKARY